MKKKSMKNVTTHLAASAAMLVLTVGVFGSSQALAGIASTKHNLGSLGTGVNKFDGTAELCVFCHTPHGADTTASVPLWNRKLPNPTTYTTYNTLGTSSLDGATVAVGSVSIACLSCHDGAQAMNVMINQPGSGGYNAAGAAMSGTWTGANQTGGAIKAGLITNIGIDLQNDHPIGIQYGGGPTSGTVPAAPAVYTNTLFKDADFKSANSGIINGKSVWWVEAGGSAAGRQKTDMQLYTRTGVSSVGTVTTLQGDQPFVECASCHDPHTETATFLRISNANSAVCLACHIK